MSRSRKNTPYSSQVNSRSTSPTLPHSLEETPLLPHSRPPTPSFAVTSYTSYIKSTDSLESLKSIVFVSKSSQTISSSLRSRPVYIQTDNISSPEFIPTNSIQSQTDPIILEKADLEGLVQRSDLSNLLTKTDLEDIKTLLQKSDLEEIKKSVPKPKVTFNPEQLFDKNILKIQTILNTNTNKISNIIITSEKRFNSKIRSTLCLYLIPVYILTLITLVVTIIITLI